MTWSATAPEGNESHKIRWDIVPYTRGSVLDLGSGGCSPFVHFTGVDVNQRDNTLSGRPVAVYADCSKPLPQFGDESWDAVFSSHLLEHIEDWQSALKEWWRIVRVGGYLTLYLPHKDLYPHAGTKWANPDHKRDFLPADIFSFMTTIGGFDLVEDQVRDQSDEYSFFQVYRKRDDQKMMDYTKNRPEKTAAVFRCGAFGDMIQASSVIKALKADGYAVTLYTSPAGYVISKHDPNVARFMLQDQDQVPNHMLGEYWKHIAKQYTKFVNLSGTVEEGLLAMPGNVNHRWPHVLRHSMLDRNYMEFQHAIAQVNAPIEPLFYSTPEERGKALAFRATIKGALILWSVAGSAAHKVWPHYMATIDRIIDECRDVTIAIVGDERSRTLANGLESSRVLNVCGVWNIRESMSMCEQADLIVGPETGLLNAAGHMDIAKIVMLSHSSKENLTKHWKNTVSMEPVNTPCYPCHILHKGFEHCHEVKPDFEVIRWARLMGIKPAGASLCMENISSDRVCDEVKKVLDRVKASRIMVTQ